MSLEERLIAKITVGFGVCMILNSMIDDINVQNIWMMNRIVDPGYQFLAWISYGVIYTLSMGAFVMALGAAIVVGQGQSVGCPT